MGNVLGTVAAGDVEEEHSLKLVLSILPVVGDLSKRLASKFGKRDKRYSYLVNIQTSAGILTAHLNEIEEDGDTKSFEPEINEVADCLENIFSNQVVKLSKLKPSKYPRLHAVQEIASTSKDLESTMEDLFDPSTLGNPAAWNRLQRNLKSLTDQLQSHGDNVDETEELGFPTTEPNEEACNFVNRALDAVHCNCHAKSQHEIRLRIGTYKKGKSKPKPESLSVLLAREKPLLQWHELLIHDQPQRKHPEILELGVILLEIHLGQRLESFLEDGRDITTNNDFYLSAWEVYIKQKHQIISVEYRKAIEGCLSPATFAGTDSDIQKLRSQGENSASMLSFERCLDERVSPTTMLSDAKTRTEDKRMRSDWTKWLNDFKTFRQQILPDVVDPENQQRVRVTVIDTGIDGSQPYIRSMGWRSDDKNAGEPLFYDFVQPDSAHGTHDPIDEDGHGTFIAGLLLQLAPDIELSVARIGATRESIQNDAQVGKKIGRAIKHAIETWNTEIISMSFGSEDLLSEVRDAIEEALKRNIIILAAAGNSGNRRGISYPASEERVFKVFAAKASGYTAEFSPPTAEDQYSYFILGCGVVSTWPSNLREKAAIEELEVFCYGSKEGHEHSEKCDTRTVMSGTSFATPIASALVAIIYQFYDANQPLPSQVRLRNGSENRFKTPQAVRAIFTKMSRKSSHAPYNLLEPGRGRDNFFYFRPHTHPELGNVSPLNIDSDTPIQFFSKKLSEALLQDGI
ncbi:hypothetical protein CEP51_004336 [Fusarium floridanum]|uniref:Uncharacterized protein n=1 Tax=Fusarium floridanum TaxID=1325733 RepID=A0A428S1M6_9HYPO|nr:hypothetical protein CEP51_004336 [Fusarium floridanum]